MISKNSIKHTLLFILLLPLYSSADTPRSKECGECVERKRIICADECELVPTGRSLNCQSSCIEGYCDHRCKPGAPEIKEMKDFSCEECLDFEFNSSESVCKVGSARIIAKCKIENSEERCKAKCK